MSNLGLQISFHFSSYTINFLEEMLRQNLRSPRLRDYDPKLSFSVNVIHCYLFGCNSDLRCPQSKQC